MAPTDLIFRPILSDMFDLDGVTCRIIDPLQGGWYLVRFPSGLERAVSGSELIIPYPHGR